MTNNAVAASRSLTAGRRTFYWLRGGAWLGAAVFSLIAVGEAWAGDGVLAVLSSSLEQYKEAMGGFRSCFSGKVSEQSLEGGTPEAVLKDAIIREKPALLLVIGGGAVQAARTVAPTVPVVFAMIFDPEGNAVPFPGVALDLKAETQVAHVRQNFPAFRRVGVVHGPKKYKSLIDDFRRQQGVVLKEVPSYKGLIPAMTTLAKEADCLLMVTDPEIYVPAFAPQVILHSLQLGLPLIAISPAYVRAGALAGVYADSTDNGCQAGHLAAALLAGDRSQIETFSRSSQVRLSVNLIVADRLKVSVSDDVLKKADFVIK